MLPTSSDSNLKWFSAESFPTTGTGIAKRVPKLSWPLLGGGIHGSRWFLCQHSTRWRLTQVAHTAIVNVENVAQAGVHPARPNRGMLWFEGW